MCYEWLLQLLLWETKQVEKEGEAYDRRGGETDREAESEDEKREVKKMRAETGREII